MLTEIHRTYWLPTAGQPPAAAAAARAADIPKGGSTGTVEPLRPGLRTALHLSRFRAIPLTPLHSIPLSFEIPPSQVCQGLPLDVFPCILAC